MAGLDAAGDEPLMLALALPAVPIIVGPSRYVSGRLAEERFGVTVHLLDDGFQHVQLERDVDLLVTDEHDVSDVPVPFGRLRERVTAASAADAALVHGPDEGSAERVAQALGLSRFFLLERALGVPRMIAPHDDTAVPPRANVLALAGIARPERFFEDLRSAGWHVVATMRFRDHHRFTAADVERITAATRSANAMVITTEKDAVRLAAQSLGGLTVAAMPLTVKVEPAAGFASWLRDRLDRARDSRHRERGAPS